MSAVARGHSRPGRNYMNIGDETAVRQVTGQIVYFGPMTERPRFHANDHSRDNLVLESHAVTIEDARLRDIPPSLDREGFTLIRHRSAIDDFRDLVRVAEIVDRAAVPDQREAFPVKRRRDVAQPRILDRHGMAFEHQIVARMVVGMKARPFGHRAEIDDLSGDLPDRCFIADVHVISPWPTMPASDRRHLW